MEREKGRWGDGRGREEGGRRHESATVVFLLSKPGPISQSPIRYAASKLVSNAAFFAKGARLAVKSVADRVGGAAAKPMEKV